MKTMKIFALILPLGILTLSSCSECSVCTKTDSPEVRICRDDYDEDQDYHNAIGFMELAGYDCDESL
jgi:hypothetical protein